MKLLVVCLCSIFRLAHTHNYGLLLTEEPPKKNILITQFIYSQAQNKRLRTVVDP